MTPSVDSMTPMEKPVGGRQGGQGFKDLEELMEVKVRLY